MSEGTGLTGAALTAPAGIADADAEHVRFRVESVLPQNVPGPLLSTRIKLAVLDGASRPAFAQATICVGWRVIRACVAAPTMSQAGDLLAARLTDQMEHAGRRTPRPWPDPTARQRPEPVSLPVGQRTVKRHKDVVLATCSPAKAALRMDAYDHDVHLFVDADTGQDAVVYRVGPTGYRLARTSSMAPPSRIGRVPLTVSAQRVPTLTSGQAIARLNATDAAYCFFVDQDTRRGNLLYRRFDGHYGLVRPVR